MPKFISASCLVLNEARIIFAQRPQTVKSADALELFECVAGDTIEHFATTGTIKELIAKQIFDTTDNNCRRPLFESLYVLFKTICYLELSMPEYSDNINAQNSQIPSTSSSITSSVLIDNRAAALSQTNQLNETVRTVSEAPTTSTNLSCSSSSRVKHYSTPNDADAYDRIIELLGIGHCLTQTDIDQSGLTELHFEVARKNVYAVEKLVDSIKGRTFIDAKASKKFLGITPLLLSVLVESYWCGKHLLEAGADVSAKDANDHGFLDYLKRTSWASILSEDHLRSLNKLIEELKPMLHISGQMDDDLPKIYSNSNDKNEDRIGRIIKKISSSKSFALFFDCLKKINMSLKGKMIFTFLPNKSKPIQ